MTTTTDLRDALLDTLVHEVSCFMALDIGNGGKSRPCDCYIAHDLDALIAAAKAEARAHLLAELEAATNPPQGLRAVLSEMAQHVRHYDVPDDRTPAYGDWLDAWADRIHAASGVPRMQQVMAEQRKALEAATAREATLRAALVLLYDAATFAGALSLADAMDAVMDTALAARAVTTYRHAVSDDGFCGVCIYDGDSPICADPTPDPASPCGTCGHGPDIHAGCGCCVGEGGCDGECFLFVATRCATCGHAIEVTD